jgi:hypothetical protein
MFQKKGDAAHLSAKQGTLGRKIVLKNLVEFFLFERSFDGQYYAFVIKNEYSRKF